MVQYSLIILTKRTLKKEDIKFSVSKKIAQFQRFNFVNFNDTIFLAIYYYSFIIISVRNKQQHERKGGNMIKVKIFAMKKNGESTNFVAIRDVNGALICHAEKRAMKDYIDECLHCNNECAHLIEKFIRIKGQINYL